MSLVVPSRPVTTTRRGGATTSLVWVPLSGGFLCSVFNGPARYRAADHGAARCRARTCSCLGWWCGLPDFARGPWPAVTEAGVSEAEWLAFLAGHGELTGASAASPVGSAVATAAATAAAATVASPGLRGKVTALLGGIGKWFFGSPAPTAPGVPQAPGGGGTFCGTAAYGACFALSAIPAPYFGTVTMTITATGSGITGGQGGGTKSTSIWAKRKSDGTYTSIMTPQWVDFGASGQTATVTINLGGTSPSTSPYSGITLAGPFYYAYGGHYQYSAPNNVWASASADLPLASATSNPARTIEQTVTCKRADGTTSTVTSSTNVGPLSAGNMIEIAGLMCPSGSRAVGVDATLKTPGAADMPIVSEPYVPGAGLDAGTSNIPEPCYSGTTCHLELEKATGPGTWAKVDPEAVPDWWTDPVRDQTYRCVYGAGSTWLVLKLTACEVYSTPKVGIAKPTADPASDPAPSDTSGDCSFGWSDLLNGGIFVRGSKCVLRWAFIPTGGFEAVVAGFSSTWGASPIGTWVNTEAGGPVTDIGGGLADTGSTPCGGPQWTITLGGEEYAFKPLDSCSEPLKTLAPIVKGLSGFFIAIAGALAAFNPLLRALGLPVISWGWTLRPARDGK